MTKKFTRENTPNASILVESLRHLGYKNSAAIADLVDNGLDAEADNIIIDVSDDDKTKGIIINLFDDGIGMNERILDEALRLGSNTSHHVDSELGKFGMGLSTASISIARVVTVITKQKDNDRILSSTQDIDEIIKENAFVKTLGEASVEEQAELQRYMISVNRDSGTLVKLSKCDGLTKRKGDFIKELQPELARIFREYLNAGKKIIVNATNLEPFDIFMLSNKEADKKDSDIQGDLGEIYSDELYDVKFKFNGKEITEKIRVRLGMLPNFGTLSLNKKYKINQKNQGFSVLRNNREIIFGDTLGFFVRHNRFNRFRGEISISGNLDEVCGITFKKDSVELNQSLHDSLIACIEPQIKAIERKLTEMKKAKSSVEIKHKEAEDHIKKKAALLKKPAVSNVDREQVIHSTEETKIKEKEHGNTETNQEPKKGLDVQFEHLHLGRAGHIYEVRRQGHMIFISWNIDHPFYEKFIMTLKDNKDLLNAVDYLVFSMASAELMISNGETYEVIDEFKNVMSLNLNTLLR
ncbi:ATP-binding protein [Lysinibacillus sp. NPDC097279]|uniref:ATP-binding protein n=1 Tax=Lysinibacillus sp. NPDC097279 TaxID=3364143 RepID=UPI00380ED54D